MESFETRIDLGSIRQTADTLKFEIGKYIIGQQQTLDLLLIAMLADGHVLLEGVPGVAKTLMSKLLAKTINAKFKRIQFTPDLMPSDIIGTMVYNAKTGDFDFKRGPLFANIVLTDEINRAPAKTQAALFEAMEERQITVDGTTHILEKPFMVMATQNPIEQEGTYRLPEAQLDRFLFKIEVSYPNLEEEKQILKTFHVQKNVVDFDSIKGFLSPTDIAKLRAIVQQVHIEDNLVNYIAQIVHETRSHNAILLGASPRASLAIMNAAKACATLRGRDFISPDDVKYVTPHVLKHRIILTPEKEMEGVHVTEVINMVIDKIEIPR
ncbi:MAG TPA: MoxR family ATPase [Bacteroidia bacterium]|jgi:MoxR-like ATPase|nr:MoxR family ATPase [Bacteroidia bacterium]